MQNLFPPVRACPKIKRFLPKKSAKRKSVIKHLQDNICTLTDKKKSGVRPKKFRQDSLSFDDKLLSNPLYTKGEKQAQNQMDSTTKISRKNFFPTIDISA